MDENSATSSKTVQEKYHLLAHGRRGLTVPTRGCIRRLKEGGESRCTPDNLSDQKKGDLKKMSERSFQKENRAPSNTSLKGLTKEWSLTSHPTYLEELNREEKMNTLL